MIFQIFQVQGRAELEAIIELIFKKAVTEPHYSHWERFLCWEVWFDCECIREKVCSKSNIIWVMCSTEFNEGSKINIEAVKVDNLRPTYEHIWTLQNG